MGCFEGWEERGAGWPLRPSWIAGHVGSGRLGLLAGPMRRTAGIQAAGMELRKHTPGQHLGSQTEHGSWGADRLGHAVDKTALHTAWGSQRLEQAAAVVGSRW